MITRGFPNVISSDLAGTTAWYVDLLGWVTEFDSDWFVHLTAPDDGGVELGIIAADHPIVPSGVVPGGGGILLTFVVDDVDSVHRRAIELGYRVVEPPTDLFYGQRRMILTDPTGTVVDISSECQPSQAFLDSLGVVAES